MACACDKCLTAPLENILTITTRGDHWSLAQNPATLRKMETRSIERFRDTFASMLEYANEELAKRRGCDCGCHRREG